MRHRIVPLVVAACNAAIFFGSTRLRVVAEPSMFLLSSIALVTGFRQLRTLIATRAATTHAINA